MVLFQDMATGSAPAQTCPTSSSQDEANRLLCKGHSSLHAGDSGHNASPVAKRSFAASPTVFVLLRVRPSEPPSKAVTERTCVTPRLFNFCPMHRCVEPLGRECGDSRNSGVPESVLRLMYPRLDLRQAREQASSALFSTLCAANRAAWNHLSRASVVALTTVTAEPGKRPRIMTPSARAASSTRPPQLGFASGTASSDECMYITTITRR